jgi:hypothetical protein
MKTTPLQVLATALRNGEYDHKLEYVTEVVWREVRDRREELAYKRARTLDIGERVEVTGNIKPRYMIGARGTIEEIVGMNITIKLDTPIHRTGRTRVRNIGLIVVRANNVEKI